MRFPRFQAAGSTLIVMDGSELPLLDQVQQRKERGDLAGLYAARRGGNRVIHQINEDTHTIEFLHIGRRSVVYRPSG